MWCSQAVVFNSADAEGAPNRSAVYRSGKSNFSHPQNNSTSQEIMNVWVCLDISYQTNSTDKIFENKKHFPFLFQKSPHSISAWFLLSHQETSQRHWMWISPSGWSPQKMSPKGFPKKLSCEFSEAHAQLLPPTSRIIRCKKGAWGLFVETHMLLDVRCLGSSLASLWLTVVDVHFPLAEKELMAKNSVV